MNKNGKPRSKEWETDESYNRRVWFVNRFKNKNGNGGNVVGDVKEAVRLANIWVNMLLLHCRYPEKLEKMIYAVVKNNKK